MMRSVRFRSVGLFVAASGFCAACMTFPVLAQQKTPAERASAICEKELLENRGASKFQQTRIRRSGAIRFVYGVANFEDLSGVRFRCRVFRDKVISLGFLVKDPEFIDETIWVNQRPTGTEGQGVVLDEDAMALPPVGPATPRFEKAPD